MIRTQNLSFAYRQSTSIQFPDISCAPGESLLILGRSGTGKTTLLQLLAGIRKPDQGSVFIGQTDLTQMSQRELDLFRGQNIGLVFQQSHFVRSLSVKENLLLAQRLAGVNKDLERIQFLLSRLELADKLDQKTQNLSVGEQQRVAIVRAILNKPRLILADEPTSALDDENCDEVFRLLSIQAQQEEAALIIVTHDNRLKSQVLKQVEMEPITY
ncbi:MAG: ATP-binding cassette domain-containing protein [Bacteroidota bacterium]